MGQNISWLGNDYQNVPWVQFPKTGGGVAQFDDTAIDASVAAVESDIAAGKQAVVNGVLLTGTGSGGGEYDWLGKNAEIVDDNVYDFETTLDNTQFAGWTPSSSARTCIATKTAKTRAVTDMDDNEYFLVWECGGDFAYNSGTTDKARPLFSRSLLIQNLFKRPSSWAMIQGDGFNGNTCATVLSANFLRYYGSTAGTLTYSWGVTYGFYFGAQAATFSPTTGNATITIKTPLFYARTSNTYLSAANAGLIDQANSTVYMKGKLFRIKRDGILRGGYGLLTDMINGNGW